MLAVNENGLVGRVVSVGQHSSRVLMLDDYNSRIPVMGESSRVRAVLAGQATRRPELSLYPYQLQAPRMDFIVGADIDVTERHMRDERERQAAVNDQRGDDGRHREHPSTESRSEIVKLNVRRYAVAHHACTDWNSAAKRFGERHLVDALVGLELELDKLAA